MQICLVMKKNFFRKVGFGIGPNEHVPVNPIDWAQSQVDKVPPLVWGEPVRTLSLIHI